MDDYEYLARRHAEHFKLTWPQVWIPMDSPIRAAYGAWSAPTCVLIGPDGRIVSNKERDEAKRRTEIFAAFAEKTRPSVPVEDRVDAVLAFTKAARTLHSESSRVPILRAGRPGSRGQKAHRKHHPRAFHLAGLPYTSTSM
jgi:hypothetical protein